PDAESRRKLSRFAKPIGRDRESYQRRPRALQRTSPRLQHARERFLRAVRGQQLQLQAGRVFRSGAGIAKSAGSEILTRNFTTEARRRGEVGCRKYDFGRRI